MLFLLVSLLVAPEIFLWQIQLRGSADAFDIVKAPVVSWSSGLPLELLRSASPVLIRRSPASQWKALRRWSVTYLEDQLLPERRRLVTGSAKSCETSLGNMSSDRWLESVWSVFRDKQQYAYSDLIGSFDCPNTTRVESRLSEVFNSADQQLRLFKMTMKDFVEKLYEDIKGWEAFAWPNNLTGYHDSDIWITSSLTVSYPHYDLQHNFYAVVSGEKRFRLLSPTSLARIKIFPYHHPRQRQVQQHGIFSDSSDADDDDPTCLSDDDVDSMQIVEADVKPGEVLYIPSMWIHSGFSLTDTIALGSCVSAPVEELISILETIPLPFELSWSLLKRLRYLTRFVDLMTSEFLSANQSKVFPEGLLSSLYDLRYRDVFSPSAIDALIASIPLSHNPDPSWDWTTCSLAGISESDRYSGHNRGNTDLSTFEEKSLLLFRRLRRSNIDIINQIGIHVLRIISADVVEQWAEFIIPEVPVPVFVAACR
jgi:hypothetical protein